jgi:CRISPR-associated protein Cas1
MPDAYIFKDGTNLVIEAGKKEVGRVPIHNIQSVICFGYQGTSPAAMRLCTENNVSLSFMTPNGRFQASVVGESKGNVLLRREQYRVADSQATSMNISKNMILGKFMNSRYVLRRGKNDHGDKIDLKKLDDAIDSITAGIKTIGDCTDPNSLRGTEGDVARSYFSALNELIIKQKDEFFIHTRNRRPPTDNMNSLLSFLYTLLAHDVRSALETNGLDPYVGFLHTDRPGRPSLALDMMEELRPIFADRLALNLVNLRKISGNGFVEKENGSIIMSDETRKTVLENWQSRKDEEVFHPFIEEKIKFGLVPHVQAMLMARYLRGDIDGYPPFLMKQVRQ